MIFLSEETRSVPTLSATARARLPDSAFAYIDSQGRRRLPINDISHVRNALARFDQVDFEDDAAREKARERLLRAAKRHGIVPLGFFDGQLRKGQRRKRALAPARDPDLPPHRHRGIDAPSGAARRCADPAVVRLT